MNHRADILLISIFFTIFIMSCDKHPCLKLPACEQYECRNPGFYCSDTLYTSNVIPKDIQSAQKIVQGYISSISKQGKIGFTTQSKSPYFWFNVTVNFEDGSSYGYEVGPDGNIYETKRKN